MSGELSGIALMNLAAMDTGDLVLLKGAMVIGLGVELDPDRRAVALEVIEAAEAEIRTRRAGAS
jgi:hypothetical protein